MLKCINSFSWFPWLVLLISLGRFYPYFGLLHSHFVIHNTSLCYATHTMLTCLCQDYEIRLNKVCYSWKLSDERIELWPTSYIYYYLPSILLSSHTYMTYIIHIWPTSYIYYYFEHIKTHLTFLLFFLCFFCFLHKLIVWINGWVEERWLGKGWEVSGEKWGRVVFIYLLLLFIFFKLNFF